MTRGPCALLALLCSRSRKSGADKAKKKIKDGDLTLGPTRRSIRNEGKLVTYSADALWEQQARAESPEAARIERELEVRHEPSLPLYLRVSAFACCSSSSSAAPSPIVPVPPLHDWYLDLRTCGVRGES